MKHGQWERAEGHFRSALDINPLYADLHFNLALALRAQRLMPESLVELEKSLDINGRFAKAHLYVGLVRYETGAQDAGIAALRSALEFEPGFQTEAFEKGLGLSPGRRHAGGFAIV